MGIHDLPSELLSEIASHLDFLDVLLLRQSTSILREATEARVVWYSLARRYSARHFNIPRPENGTIDALGTGDLREWIWPRLEIDQIWRKKIAVHTMRTLRMQNGTASASFIPGGRWLLATRNTGHIDSYDLNSKEPIPRVLLEPSAHGGESRPANLTVDINHEAPTLDFRFAFSATGAEDTGSYPSSWLHIRQARLVGTGPAATLAAHKLVSIPHIRSGPICTIGLCGDRVARAVITAQGNLVEVFNWKECTSTEFMVASIRIQEDIRFLGRFYFIGEDRVLFISQNIFIYKLPPFSCLVRRPGIGYQSNEDVTPPTWIYSEIPLTSNSPPSFSFDGIDSYRLVVQDRCDVVGIYIPLSPDQQPSVRFRIQPGPPGIPPVGIGRYKGWTGHEGNPPTRFGYEWDDVDTNFVNAQGRRWISFWQVLFDEETGRCLLRKGDAVIKIVDFIQPHQFT